MPWNGVVLIHALGFSTMVGKVAEMRAPPTRGYHVAALPPTPSTTSINAPLAELVHRHQHRVLLLGLQRALHLQLCMHVCVREVCECVRESVGWERERGGGGGECVCVCV